MKQIGIIIQARINSSRLPGKVLKYLDDKRLIQWIIKRVKKTKIEKIILATGNQNKNLELKKISQVEKINFYAGSEKNVLERFYMASKKYKLDAIIRVCADNPFVDFREINNLIEEYKKTKFKKDYYFNHRNYKNISYADGFGAELIDFTTLKKLYKNASSNSNKEHVTSLIWNNKIQYNMQPCKTVIPSKYHHIVCDINNLDDYEKIKEFINKYKISINSSSLNIARLYSLFEIEKKLKDLFNVNRSLAGKENRKTLKYIKKDIPIKIKNFPSGKKVFDWRIPKEWSIKKGYIKDSFGNKLIDINKNFLHVASYSQKIHKKINFDQLKKKIFVGNFSNAIPYRTLYYKKDWAFCMNKKDFKKIQDTSLKKDIFEICIDSKFINGKMNYGEILIKGKSKKEILISTYICHPSMANDNLSGIILTSLLARFIQGLPNLKWSYRIIFIPETIGSIAYIKYNLNKIKKIDIGINISCVGGKGLMSYKETRDSENFLNQLIENIFNKLNIRFKKHKFDIHGSDERQYSYFGNDINVLSVHKDKFYDYKEYHTSLDNLDFVKKNNLFSSFDIYKKLILKIEEQEIYISKNNFTEPMLSKYKLYPDTGGSLKTYKDKIFKNLDNILWILYLCDGKKTLSQIKKKLNLGDKTFSEIISILKQKKLISHI